MSLSPYSWINESAKLPLLVVLIALAVTLMIVLSSIDQSLLRRAKRQLFSAGNGPGFSDTNLPALNYFELHGPRVTSLDLPLDPPSHFVGVFYQGTNVTGSVSDMHAVPEPMSLSLLGLGLAFGIRSWRARRL